MMSSYTKRPLDFLDIHYQQKFHIKKRFDLTIRLCNIFGPRRFGGVLGFFKFSPISYF